MQKADITKDVRFALGKSDFTGSLQVSMRATSYGFEVAQLNCSGSFDDLYDYKWPGEVFIGIIDTTNCTLAQAGHATLAAVPTPDAGRLF